MKSHFRRPSYDLNDHRASQLTAARSSPALFGTLGWAVCRPVTHTPSPHWEDKSILESTPRALLTLHAYSYTNITSHAAPGLSPTELFSNIHIQPFSTTHVALETLRETSVFQKKRMVNRHPRLLFCLHIQAIFQDCQGVAGAARIQYTKYMERHIYHSLLIC